MTSHCPECHMVLADNEDCLHIKGGHMKYPDEHKWPRQYDRTLKPWQIAMVYLGLLGFGILATIGLAQLVLIFVELIL